MANEDECTIDNYGRVVIPKDIREKINASSVVFIYDHKNEDVHMIPVRDLSYWAGKAGGITKEFSKKHEEDWYDPYR